jgi:hypothetical protein
MKRFILAALGITSLGVILFYLVLPVQRDGLREAILSTTTAGDPMPIPQLGRATHILFRNKALGEVYGRLSVVPVDARDGSATPTSLRCDRLHFAADHGVCLSARRGVFTTYEAIIFDSQFQPRHTLPLSGLPSRTRVSPNGRVAAITVFVGGHSYAAKNFSTQTMFVDLQRGEAIVPDMEQFTVRQQGQPFRAVDANFWGVTFAPDSNRFYATLGTGGQTYLIEGNLSRREVQILKEGIECPSLSPDNARIVFKRRASSGWGPISWRLFALDLATFSERPLAEARSIDDQVEWLDDQHVLYTLSERTLGRVETTVWVTSVDGGEPRRFMSDAYSPAVVRPTAGTPQRAPMAEGRL